MPASSMLLSSYINTKMLTLLLDTDQRVRQNNCMNLSAPFTRLVPPSKAVLTKTLPHVDVLFGNETAETDE